MPFSMVRAKFWSYAVRAFVLTASSSSRAVLRPVPETTPVNEMIETAFALEDRVGVRLGPVVVNGVDQGTDLPDADDVDVALAAAGLDDEVAVE